MSAFYQRTSSWRHDASNLGVAVSSQSERRRGPLERPGSQSLRTNSAAVAALPDSLSRLARPLLEDLEKTFEIDLVGAYAYGSGVFGDFDPAVSDLDVLVVTERSIDETRLGPLRGIVERQKEREPEWAERLDLVFAGRRTLAEFRTTSDRIASVSHDEPLQLYGDVRDWLQTWFEVQEADAALVGPSPRELIPHVDRSEFIEAVVASVDFVVRRAKKDPRPGQLAYSLLTLCRVLYSQETGGITSKNGAAAWAAVRFPDAAALLREALQVRRALGRQPFADARAVLGLIDRLGAEARNRDSA